MGKVTIKNPSDFANALLGDLGDPDSKIDVSNIDAWEAAEGGNWHNSAKYNPLNTEMQEPGSVSMGGGSKVQSYTSWQEGLDATVATLEQPGHGYSQILSDLSTSQPWLTFKKSVAASGWDGSSHYAGNSVFGSNTPPSGTTNPQAYSTGVNAGQTANTAANSPGKGNANLTGFAGVLQELQTLYSPSVSTTVWGFIPDVPTDIGNTLTMIFVRGMSSIVFTLLIGFGVSTLLHGESSGGGSSSSSPTNILEFVNKSQQANTRNALSGERLNIAKTKEANTQTRHEQRLSDNEAARQARVAHEKEASARLEQRLKDTAATRRTNAKKARDLHARHEQRLRDNALARRARQKLANTPRVIVKHTTVQHVKG